MPDVFYTLNLLRRWGHPSVGLYISDLSFTALKDFIHDGGDCCISIRDLLCRG
jgi:hypothetical protein